LCWSESRIDADYWIARIPLCWSEAQIDADYWIARIHLCWSEAQIDVDYWIARIHLCAYACLKRRLTRISRIVRMLLFAIRSRPRLLIQEETFWLPAKKFPPE
jgi:hypothetical protein